MTTSSSFRLEYTIQNYKSYYGDPTKLILRKPFTVLAGPNGEGKSNLLEGMLIPSSEFIMKARKFNDSALYRRRVEVCEKPEIHASFDEIIFHDHMLRSLHQAWRDLGPPRRLHPGSTVSDGYDRGALTMRIVRERGRHEKLMARMSVRYEKGRQIPSRIRVNEMDDFEILYSDSDASTVDFLVHLFASEMERRDEAIPGRTQKARFVRDVLELFPDGEQRLIRDVAKHGFLERFLDDTHRFLRQNLATGAKKETLVYLIALVLQRFEPSKNNLLLVLLDEFEGGINVMRQKLLVDAFVHLLKRYPDRAGQIRIVLTTHSPVVFSELKQHEDLVDVFYVLREHNGPSEIYLASEDKSPQEAEKRIVLELGLSVFNLPKQLIFVEGRTDADFFNAIFQGCKIVHLDGGKLPKILRQFLGTLQLAWDKRYAVLVDANKLDSVKADIARIHADHGETVAIEAASHGFDSLEEFLLGTDMREPLNTTTLWARLEERFQEIDHRLGEIGCEPLDIDIVEARERLEHKQKEGIRIFLQSLKSHERFYRLFGEHWRQLLTETGREFVSQFQRKHHLVFVSAVSKG